MRILFVPRSIPFNLIRVKSRGPLGRNSSVSSEFVPAMEINGPNIFLYKKHPGVYVHGAPLVISTAINQFDTMKWHHIAFEAKGDSSNGSIKKTKEQFERKG